jgi:2-oxoglutarate dehydrogenase E2 component (dihydrolipoamide succinyltransferase)
VKKDDVLNYLSTKSSEPKSVESKAPVVSAPAVSQESKPSVPISGGDEIVEMDRMRKIIAEHMVKSIQTSVHVTNMVEADVTNLVQWRNSLKGEFEKREKTKLTFMPAFIEAAARALRDFPMVNASVDGTKM